MFISLIIVYYPLLESLYKDSNQLNLHVCYSKTFLRLTSWYFLKISLL